MSQRSPISRSAPDPTMPSRTRRSRVGIGALAATVLFAAVALWASPGAAVGTNTFTTSSFGTGTEADGTECWRGFVFQTNEAIEVTALIGGADLEGDSVDFQGALWDVSYESATGDYTFTSLLASVIFPEGLNQTAPLDTPVTLTPGQWYVIGTGPTSSVTGAGMYEVLGFDSTNIPDPAGPIADWLPANSSRSLTLGICRGNPSEFVGTTRNAANNTSGLVPAIGFVSGPPTPPTTTTVPGPTTTTTTVPNTTPVPNQPVVSPRFTG